MNAFKDMSMQAMGLAARHAAKSLARASTEQKNAALTAMARNLRQSVETLLAANAIDLKTARDKDYKAAFVDRLTLTPSRIDGMAKGIEVIAALPDPVGRIMASWSTPNDLKFERVAVPIGVIGIIYESRPNVTADAGSLCLKSGNAAILRGGSDSFETSKAITQCLQQGLAEAGLDGNAIQMVMTSSREAVGEMLSGLNGTIDLIVPRGGKSLTARVQSEARVPVFAHLEGICHVYVDRDADLAMAEKVILNAKMRRTGVCGAAETILVDRAIAGEALPKIIKALNDAACEVRGDAETQAFSALVKAATEEDWRTEYLDAIIAIRVVDGVDQAIAHIAAYGSQHTESIITTNTKTAEHFLKEVDSAIVMHNASTQFADGGEFGFGAEIGIATGRMHARGPVGLEQLTTFKYKVRGAGQLRPV
jgi:glutamate-5-semialdehyde dehydrogenase